MNKFAYSMLALAISLTSMSSNAQKPKKKVVVRKAAAVAKPKIDPAVEAMKERMMEAVQKIVFFDSIVVDKAQFLDAYNLDPDIATISTYDKFFSTSAHPGSYVCANGMKTRSYFSIADTLGNTSLYRSDFVDGDWSAALPVEGIDTNQSFSKANFPYMMTDGQTFYFAAKGSESLGGYDIFVTRYDADSKSFLQPENIGMPFNSTANDYMYVIDDINKIGWFASDRNQPEGKVCIYKFVPSTVRENYDSSELDDNRLESYAQIRSIADTWAGNSNVRQDAIDRYSEMQSRLNQSRNTAEGEGGMFFVINDNNVYTSAKQFLVKANVERYRNLCSLKDEYANTNELLDQLRKQYSVKRSNGVQTSIISAERECDRLRTEISTIEKLIVNTENKALKNN